MTWTKLSDDFSDRPDLLACSRSARLLHVEALVYCNRQLTDGTLPAAALRRITDADDPGADVAELIAAGVWVEAGPGGWQVDFSDQEASADVRKRQQLAAQRSRRYRLHKSGDHSECDPKWCRHVTRDVQSHEQRDDTQHATPSRPDPSRPGPAPPDGMDDETAANMPRCALGTPFASDGTCCAAHAAGVASCATASPSTRLTPASSPSNAQPSSQRPRSAGATTTPRASTAGSAKTTRTVRSHASCAGPG